MFNLEHKVINKVRVAAGDIVAQTSVLCPPQITPVFEYNSSHKCGVILYNSSRNLGVTDFLFFFTSPAHSIYGKINVMGYILQMRNKQPVLSKIHW